FPEEIVVCDETQDDGAFTACGRPIEITVDMFNTTLYGAFAPAASVRRAALIDAVAKLDSNIVCLAGVSSDADKAAIANAALAKFTFPYSATFADTLDTAIDDPTDQNGVVPSPPTTPACAGSTAGLDDLMSCI